MRGTVAGREILKSTKKIKRADAKKIAEIEARKYEQAEELSDVKLFVEAAAEYLEADGDGTYMELVIERLGMYYLPEINQEIMDKEARIAFPKQSNATRVRQFYTPAIAVHNFSSLREWCAAKKFIKPTIEQKPTEWAELDWFEIFWQHCNDNLYRATVFLPYTGCRISEALNLTWDRVNLDGKWAYIDKTKNKTPRTVNLPETVIEALSTVPKDKREGKVFPWSEYRSFNRAVKRTVDFINKERRKENLQPIKYFSSHKLGSHTYGTWMRRDANVDIKGLVDTGRWKDLRSAARYTHTSATEANKKSDKLPKINTCKIRAGGVK